MGYSAGFELSYLSVKRHMGDYGTDLACFFSELGQQFEAIHIICHSCGAEFFFLNAEDIISCFAPARGSSSSNSSEPVPSPDKRPSSPSLDGKKPHLLTLTMVNPDVLVDVVNEKLPKVMEVAEHFTTYNDQKDGALFWSAFVHNYIPNRLKRGTMQAGAGRRPVIFGSVVSPLWLEGSPSKLQGPMLELVTAKGCPWSSNTDKMRKLPDSGGRVRADSRIDVIDCSTIDQIIHKLRHNYYMLNTQVVEDICELIGSQARAAHRGRLVRVEANVFNFLCPPAELIDL